MNTLFHVNELGNILEQSNPRTYKSNKIIDGKHRVIHIVPYLSGLRIYVQKREVIILGSVHTFDDRNASNIKHLTRWGELKKRIQKYLEEHHPKAMVDFTYEVNRYYGKKMIMKNKISFNTDKLICTNELKQAVELFKNVNEFSRRQSF